MKVEHKDVEVFANGKKIDIVPDSLQYTEGEYESFIGIKPKHPDPDCEFPMPNELLTMDSVENIYRQAAWETHAMSVTALLFLSFGNVMITPDVMILINEVISSDMVTKWGDRMCKCFDQRFEIEAKIL